MGDIYSGIITRAGRKIQKTDTAYKTKLKDWANEVYGRLYERFFWNELFREVQVSVSAGANYLILPRDVELVLYISDLTNDILVRRVGVQGFQKRYLSRLDQSGVLYAYAHYGYSPVAVQLATAGTVEILSSSASDTTQKVYVRGYDSNGLELNGSISLNGTSVVATGSPTLALFAITNPRTGLSMVSKDGDTVGVVTIRETTTDTVLVRLGPLDRTVRHKIIRLVEKPSSSLTPFVGYKEPIRRLVNDGDVPQFKCSDLIVQGVFIEALKEQRQFQRATIEDASFEKSITTRLQQEARDQESEDGVVPEAALSQLDIDTPCTF